MRANLDLKNARIVLEDEIVSGSVSIRDGQIHVVSAGVSDVGEDMEGDYLIPGLVELHTDHLEGHYAPRPKVRWHPIAAVLAHDAQVSASGITTVFDALRVGTTPNDDDMRLEEMHRLAEAIDDSVEKGRLRADHLIHLRCEVSTPDCLEGFESFLDIGRMRLASLMDHAPGQRQFANLDAYAAYYQGKLKMSDEVFAAFCKERLASSAEHSPGNRHAIAELCRENDIVLASHDDATVEHVDEAVGQGARVAEFPTTEEAAGAAHGSGMAVLMGAPNLVRGGSHSGNVSAHQLVENGHLDILSSDYIPFSMIQSAFHLAEEDGETDLPQAINMVSRNPARAVGLEDRGRIGEGLRADLVRVHVDGTVPIVRSVWSQGRRVV